MLQEKRGYNPFCLNVERSSTIRRLRPAVRILKYGGRPAFTAALKYGLNARFTSLPFGSKIEMEIRKSE